MSPLTELKAAKTLHEVATLLRFKAFTLSFILYKKPEAEKYKKFGISKRNGGIRHISAPLPELKLLQRHLSIVLQSCVSEINLTNKFKDNISHGFKRKRSIITNAKKHRNRRYVFNVDLKNFFGTINFGRVRGFFIKDKHFSLDPKVATILAQIACFENSLPQGSPCSPVISNLIGHVLDIHLVQLASSMGCTYSRYADDLTFSTNKPDFPESIAKCISSQEHRWIAGKELEKLINKSGFELNSDKTRMQYRDSRQEVTGLVVNKKLNVRREYRHLFRAMVHQLVSRGSFELLREKKNEKGEILQQEKKGTMDQLAGVLGFIDSVDLYNKEISPPTNKQKDESSLSSKDSLYRRFLLYKEFYAATRPVIICEGKTDNIYLLHAIRSLVAGFPSLATKDVDGKIRLKVRIYKYADTSV